MKLAYLDCFSGISGDMFVGAFLDAGVSLEELRDLLERVPVQGWSVSAERQKRGSLTGVRFLVTVEGEQRARNLPDIQKFIATSSLPDPVKEKSSKVFAALAAAESKVHGVKPEEVHFHEVGAVDSIIDIVGAASCLHLAGIDSMYVSPLSLGKGRASTQHGLIPLPAPATSFLLVGFDVRMLDVEAELVTPTGAAIVSSLARREEAPGPFRLESVGHGAGGRELKELPNVLRVFFGESQEAVAEKGVVEVLETTIDDMSPELYGFLQERLFELGALEVFFTAVQMKKGRPGVLLTVLCEPGCSEKLGGEILMQTTTFGLRVSTQSRMELAREVHEVSTPFGPIRVKTAPAFPERASPEYDDCRRAAREHRVPLLAVYEAATVAWNQKNRRS